MPSLADHHSANIVKLMYIGDSSTGKTGSLTSLVTAGYKIRVLDLDNGLDVLKYFVKRECPDNLKNVDYETRRDIYKATQSGPIVKGQPKAYIDSLKLLTEWTDGTSPSEWGPDTIFVLDSLTGLGKAAFEWAKGMNPGAKDPRNWYFTAQQSVENVLAMLTGEDFGCNVIIISHVNWREGHDGVLKGHPNAVGSAMGPIIPRYFNTLILADKLGSGTNVKRRIHTVPSATIDLKNPAPFQIDATLPLESGLATIFKTLKEQSDDVTKAA